MEPPADAVETSGSTVWAEDGVVVCRTSGARSTSESVEEVVGVFEGLAQELRPPLLLDARRWWGGTPEAWVAVVASVESLFSAVAMLVKPEVATEAGPFPAIIDRLLIPFQVFTDETEALEFLRGFRPGE